MSIPNKCAIGSERLPPTTTMSKTTNNCIRYDNYLVPTVEPNFGTMVTRVTDKNVFGMGLWMRHAYSRTQAWNADSSLIMLAGWTTKLLDGNTYQVRGEVTGLGSKWSYVDPRKCYYTYSNRLKSTKLTEVSPGQWSVETSVVRVFDGYVKTSLASSEHTFSHNDRYFALESAKLNDPRIWIVIYDAFTDTVVGERAFQVGTIDWVAMSPRGDYVVTSGYRGTAHGKGVEVFTSDMVFRRRLFDKGEHSDLCTDSNGEAVLVSVRGAQSVRLRDGYTVDNAPLARHGGHVSGQNFNRPGWAYVTAYGFSGPSGINTPGYNEIYAVKLDGSNTVQRFVKSHANHVVGGYYHAAMATPSPDGTKVLYASNLNISSLYTEPYPPAFIVEQPC